MRRVWVLMTVAAIVLAGCGDDEDSSSDEQALAGEITNYVVAALPSGSPLGAAEVGCMWELVVADLGIDRLAESGVEVGAFDSPEEGGAALAEFLGSLSAADVEAVADAGVDCVDLRALLVQPMAAAGIGQDSAECYADEVIDLGDTGLFLALLGVPAAVSEIEAARTSAVQSCLTPEELELLG
jgi:hypothetical protein